MEDLTKGMVKREMARRRARGEDLDPDAPQKRNTVRTIPRRKDRYYITRDAVAARLRETRARYVGVDFG